MNFFDDEEIDVSEVERSRRSGNFYDRNNSLRDNLLQLTGIDQHYDETNADVRRGNFPNTSLNWILNTGFYRGASSVVQEMQRTTFNENGENIENKLKAATEFMQFMEITIQRWMFQTSRLNSNGNIDSISFNYCQQLLCQPRNQVNNSLRQLFYHFYNGTNSVRNLNQVRWDGNIKEILNMVINLIRQTFYMEENRSDFIQLIPDLHQVGYQGNRLHRWTWELTNRPDFLTLLFALVMIRLPSKNLSEANAMTTQSFDFPIITLDDDAMSSERISCQYSDGKTNHLFYFIPEHNRVFGIWPQSVRVKNDAQAPSQRFAINYKANLMRSIILKVRLPTALMDRGGTIAFDYLFFRPNQNIYQQLRRKNPFQFAPNVDKITRLYVSLTIYANQNETVLHIPYVLEGSLLNGIDYDVSEFCNEYDRVIQTTNSGTSVNLRTVGINEFYFYFSLIHDTSLPLSVAANSEASSVASQRPRRSIQGSSSNRPSVTGMLVGAPYAGTKKEKHYLLGSMINRFTISAALFRTPQKQMNSCLMMSLIRCQMYHYMFQSRICKNVLVTGTMCESVKAENMYVECISNYDNMPRTMPFFEKMNGKWFVKLFNPSKYKNESNQFLAGTMDEVEEEYWEMAAEEIWFHLQAHYKKNLDYTCLSEYGQAFSDFFKVCISIYDVEVRCNRVHVITPFQKTPKELVDLYGNILMINLVFDQGHIHAISSLPSFVKSEGRKDELRLYNYCPVCDEKQVADLRKNKESALHHISQCVLKKDFKVGYEEELDKQLSTQQREVYKAYKKVGNKTITYYKCNQCQKEIQQHNYMEHVCYIPAKKTEIIDNSCVYVYDLECAQLVDELGLLRHECNCLMIRKVYPMNDEEKNGKYFPTEVEFVQEIMNNPIYQNALFIAFNGGSYDIHFLLRIFERGEITHTYVPSPTSKHKFIQISLTEKNIRFIDFMRFIPGSLKSIAEAFEIPVSKGDFPHKFNNGENDAYCGPIPILHSNEDYWGLDSFKNFKSKEKFIEWHKSQQLIYCTCYTSECQCEKMKWCFQDELKKYCLLDVIVLAEIVRHYREACMNFENMDAEKIMNWTVPKLDPLQFMTLPQITMQTLLHGFANFEHPDYDFHGIRSFYKKNRGGQSWEGALWVFQIMRQSGEFIYHLGNSCKEYYDFETNISVDGYAPESNTLYWYLSCSYWGCPECMIEYNEFNWIIPERGMYASDVRNNLESILESLRRNYRNVVTIWGHNFHCAFEDPYVVKSFQLMNPQDCFYGGRTEVFQLYSNAALLEKEIHYYDVTSLYPSVYAHYPLPLGNPVHVTGHQIDLTRFHPTASNRYYGFARVKVIPRKTDLIGLLPQRDSTSGRLFFPVYPMEGCWGTEELYLAMQNGYEIENIYEMYYWDERNKSCCHFAAYVNYFFQLKQEAEGWKKLGASSDTPSEEEMSMLVEKLYYQNGNLARIRPQKVKKNAVLRSLAKLYLNSLWGKFAQKSSKTNHTTIYGTQQFLNLWNHKQINQSSCKFREISPGVYKTSYDVKNEFINPVKHGNLFIAAKVTETARCVLHQKMLQVGPENVIYCDTDSVIFLYSTVMGVLTDVGLGKWTNEYPQHVIEHVYALAPKLYSLRLKLKEDPSYEVFRAKGVQLTLENQNRMLFESVKPLIENIVKGSSSPFTLPVKNFTIFSNSGNSALPYGQVYSRYNEKKVRAIITKRLYKVNKEFTWEGCSQIRTFPFGFEINADL